MREWLKQRWKRWKREHRIKKLPWTCQNCELLGICRDESRDWKCRHGCLLLDSK